MSYNHTIFSQSEGSNNTCLFKPGHQIQNIFPTISAIINPILFGVSGVQSWTKRRRQIHKIKQNRLFFYGVFYSWFFAFFYQKTSKFGFWVDGWLFAIKPKHFRDFLEISKFPKILSLKSFGNSWDNSYIHFLVIIIQFRFTCGKDTLC